MLVKWWGTGYCYWVCYAADSLPLGLLFCVLLRLDLVLLLLVLVWGLLLLLGRV
jgi:hypothetical protein